MVGSTGVSAQVPLIQYYFNGGKVTQLPIPIDPTDIQLNPDSDGLGTEFALTFSRSLLKHFQSNVGQPSPTATQPPATPFPTAATAAPTLTTTSGATASPTSLPTAPSSSNAQPTTTAQSTWILNLMTSNTARAPQDSLGPGGPNDNEFQGVDINVNNLTLDADFCQVDEAPPSNQSAQIAGGEIDNYP